MNTFLTWLGFGLRGELNKARIALGVAREIADNYKTISQNSERQVHELLVENERLRGEHTKLEKDRERDKRCHDKIAQALRSKAVTAFTRQ